MATQEKTWNVANRLHSLKDSDKPEVNHIIAGADEIYDDAKGAKQSDINAQTDAAIADRYTKAQVDEAIADIDVTEQLADYAKKTEVSTAVSAETTRAQGVEATKANASEVATALAAKQNVLTFDNTPTDGSTNPVTSGGVKAAIDAVDVSEQLEDVAFLGEDDGQAVIPEFDPQTDTLLKTTQSLTNTEKETVIGNILDKNYIAGSYVGKGKKYLKLNVGAPVATDFDGFVDGVTTEQSSLAEVPDNIYFDRTNNRFIASKGEGLLMKYYMSWQNGDAYMNPNRGAYFKNEDNYYQWNGTTLEATTVGNVNKLTQADFDAENTIYVIRYDFDLCGQSITIPEGCVLEFDGGTISNGILVCNDTFIKGEDNCLNNIFISGTLSNNSFYIDWFEMDTVTDRYDGKLTYDCGGTISNILSTQKGIKLILSAKNYTAEVGDLVMMKESALVGQGKGSTTLTLTSPSTSNYYIAMKYGCAIEKMRIIVYEYREIPIIYNSSTIVRSSSIWNQTVHDVYIVNRQYWLNSSEGSITNVEEPEKSIKTTAIKIAITPFDEDGNLVSLNNYALSYRENYDLITIQFFKKGIELFVDNSESIPSELRSSMWCTSLYFTRLTAWCLYGFVGSGKSTSRTVLSGYLFQSLKGSNLPDACYGIYGLFNTLIVQGYVNWDNSYRGKCNGIIYDLIPTVYNTNISNTGYVKLDENSELKIFNNSPYTSSLSIMGSDIGGNIGNIRYSSIYNYFGGIGLSMGAGLNGSSYDSPTKVKFLKVPRIDGDERYVTEHIEYNKNGSETRVYNKEVHEDGTVKVSTTNNKYYIGSKRFPISPVGEPAEELVFGTLCSMRYLDFLYYSNTRRVYLDSYQVRKFMPDLPSAGKTYVGSGKVYSNAITFVEYLISGFDNNAFFIKGMLMVKNIAGSLDLKNYVYRIGTSNLRGTSDIANPGIVFNFDYDLSDNYINYNMYITTSQHQGRLDCDIRVKSAVSEYFTENKTTDYTQTASIDVSNLRIGSTQLDIDGAYIGDTRLTLNNPSWWNGSSWRKYDGYADQIRKGTFAQASALVSNGKLSSTDDVGYSFFATDKGTANVGAVIYYTGDNTTPWVYADGTAVS